MTQLVLASVLGVLFAVGTYLLLQRDVVRVVWGVTLIGQTANVYLIAMGGLAGTAPVGADGMMSDPLVQALVLTAIVIGFGTTTLSLVLTYRVYEEHGTIDVYDLGCGVVAGRRERGTSADADANPDADANAGADVQTDGGPRSESGGDR